MNKKINFLQYVAHIILYTQKVLFTWVYMHNHSDCGLYVLLLTSNLQLFLASQGIPIIL